MVRMSCLASALAMSGDVWILLFAVTLSGPGFHEVLGSAPVCPLSNHTGEPWSPIVDPAIVPVPSRRSSPAFIPVMLVSLELSDCTAAILLCRMFMLVADLSSLDVMRCLTVPPLIP